MILLIDNYDSFSYNLYQLIGEIQSDIRVARNDGITLEEIRRLHPSHIILSPGPGRPENAGICIDIVKEFGDKIPILGVCLGHQAIGAAYGATIGYAKRLMHGKQSQAALMPSSPIFADCMPIIPVARYHSLAIIEKTLPSCLAVSARAEDDEIMAIQHQEYLVYGLQFHPESIMTPAGKIILQNFIHLSAV